MKKHNLIYLIILLFFFSGSCKKEETDKPDEPDDYTALIEPRSFTTYINMTKNIDPKGVEAYLTRVSFATKEGYVKIKNGSVKVNGKELKITSIPLYDGSINYVYDLEDKIEVAKEYSFDIQLSDGIVYTSLIKTQEIDLHELTVPTNHDRKENMKISWKETQPTDWIKINLSLPNGNPSAYSGLNLETSELYIDEYEIDKSRFEDTTADKVNVKVISKRTGILDSRLGGYFRCEFEIERDCNLK